MYSTIIVTSTHPERMGSSQLSDIISISGLLVARLANGMKMEIMKKISIN